MTRTGAPLGRCHFIVDLDAVGEDAAARTVLPLIAAGLPSLQIRGRGRPSKELVRAGSAFRDAASSAGCFFIVNGDLSAACELRADGLHLPAALHASFDRSAVPETMGIGTSCHGPEELARANGVDWVFVSPVFRTESKPGATPLGLDGLQELTDRTPIPVYGLGGITPDNARGVLDAGCAGVAAIRGFLRGDGLRLIEVCGERKSDGSPAPE